MVRSLLAVPAVLAVGLVSACGSSTPSVTVPPTTLATAPPSTPTATATATAAAVAPAGVDLSGIWSGQYSGIYQGTFKLTWQQSGSALSGSIQLSSPAQTLAISGNVQGTTIAFGDVGVVTYTGSVSGNSMSGNYQSPNGTGTWSATKSS